MPLSILHIPIFCRWWNCSKTNCRKRQQECGRPFTGWSNCYLHVDGSQRPAGHIERRIYTNVSVWKWWRQTENNRDAGCSRRKSKNLSYRSKLIGSKGRDITHRWLWQHAHLWYRNVYLFWYFLLGTSISLVQLAQSLDESSNAFTSFVPPVHNLSLVVKKNSVPNPSAQSRYFAALPSDPLIPNVLGCPLFANFAIRLSC